MTQQQSMRPWANVFLEAKAAYKAAGAEETFSTLLSYALTHPDGILERGHGILFFGWWVNPRTAYIARLDGPGVLALRRALQVIARDARLRDIPLSEVRVQWHRTWDPTRLYERPWRTCHRHLKAVWKMKAGS